MNIIIENIIEDMMKKKVIEMVETKPDYFEMKDFNTKTEKIEENKES